MKNINTIVENSCYSAKVIPCIMYLRQIRANHGLFNSNFKTEREIHLIRLARENSGGRELTRVKFRVLSDARARAVRISLEQQQGTRAYITRDGKNDVATRRWTPNQAAWTPSHTSRREITVRGRRRRRSGDWLSPGVRKNGAASTREFSPSPPLAVRVRRFITAPGRPRDVRSSGERSEGSSEENQSGKKLNITPRRVKEREWLHTRRPGQRSRSVAKFSSFRLGEPATVSL